MVCIAAFIILSIVSVFVGFLSIFNRELGKKYWVVFQKAWHCVFKKVRLQKCDTNFKDDVKHTLLKRIVLKHPNLLKPASALIEILSIVIVFITVWSFIIAIKSLLALWVFGTCNISHPSQCGLGSEVCSIDQVEPTDLLNKIGRGFSEWGEIFSAIPDRLKTWQAQDYLTHTSIPLIDLTKDHDESSLKNTKKLLQFYHSQIIPDSSKVAVDIIDSGCTVCRQSYLNQKQSGFLDQYFTVANLYPIPKSDSEYKFTNSKLVTDYLNSIVYLIQQIIQKYYQDPNFDFIKLSKQRQDELSLLLRLPTKMLDRLYTGSSDNRNYIDLFNYSYDHDTALKELDAWSKEFGLNVADRHLLKTVINNQEKNQTSDKRQTKENTYVKQIIENLNKNQQDTKKLVEENLKAKGIPVEIFDGKKHNGLFKLK